ncbi:MAG: hypothetical protein AB1941_04025 [Gemmatimonadota bacterium]
MRFDSVAFEKLASSVLEDSRAGRKPLIDLTSATYTSLAGLSKLIALLYTLRRADPTTHRDSEALFRPPTSRTAWNFLLLSKFFSLAALDEVFVGANYIAQQEHQYLETLARKSTRGAVIPSASYPSMGFRRILEGGNAKAVEWFQSEMSGFIGEISTVFHTALSSHLGYPPDEMRAILLLNSEIYSNIYFHSGSWGYAALQCDRRGLSIVYGDLGIGFKDALDSQCNMICERLERPWNDVTAILGGFEFGITSRSKGRPISGMGLGTIRELVMERGGVIECRSGAGRVTFSADGSLGGQVREYRVESLVGAQISVFLPIRRAV